MICYTKNREKLSVIWRAMGFVLPPPAARTEQSRSEQRSWRRGTAG